MSRKTRKQFKKEAMERYHKENRDRLLKKMRELKNLSLIKK